MVAQRGKVTDDDAPLFLVQSAFLRPEPQLLVHAFARGADHVSKILLRQFHRNSHVVSPTLAVALCEAHEHLRQARWDIP